MKSTRNLLIINTLQIFCISMVLLSCNHTTQPHLTNQYQFDSINLDYYPTKAYQKIKEYSINELTASKHEIMCYNLQLNLAKAKCFKPLPNDSTLLNYTAYFQQQGDTERLLKANLLRAYSLMDRTKYDQALAIITKTLALTNSKKHQAILAHLYSSTGNILYIERLYLNAYQTYKKAHDLYIHSKDTIMLTSSYKDLTQTAIRLNNDSAMFFLDKGLQRAKLNKDTIRLNWLLAAAANYYLDNHSIKEAQTVLNKYTSGYPLFEKTKYIALIKYYDRVKDYNMYKIYCDSLINNTYALDKYFGHFKLYKLYNKQKDYKNALYQLEEFKFWDDSLKDVQQKTNIIEIEAKYKNNILQEKNHLLKEKNISATRKIYILVLLSAILIGLICLWFYIRIKKRTLESKRRELRQKYLYERSLDHLNESKKEIERLTQITKRDSAIDSDTIITQKNVIESRIIKVKADRKHRIELEKQLKQWDIYQKIMSIVNGDILDKMTVSDWNKLENLFEQTYDNLLFTLKQVGRNLNDNEIKVCCLVKLGIPNKGISTLINKAPTTVSTMKKRIYKKITDKEGVASDLQDFMDKL